MAFTMRKKDKKELNSIFVLKEQEGKLWSKVESAFNDEKVYLSR